MRLPQRGRAAPADDAERLAEQLEQALADGDRAAAVRLARRLAERRPDDVRLAVTLAEQLLALDPREHLEEAARQLRRALSLAPGDVPALLLLGQLATDRQLDEAAEDYWRRAWTADPDRPEPGAGLLALWRRRGAVPEWGREVLERRYLEQGLDDVWPLLASCYRPGENLTASGFRALRRRWQQDRDHSPELAALLAPELVRLNRTDDFACEVLAVGVDQDPGLRAHLTFAEGRRRRPRLEAVDLYRAEAAAGNGYAASLLVMLWARGELPFDATVAAAIAQIHADPTGWEFAHLDRATLLPRAARLSLAAPTAVTPTLVSAALEIEPAAVDLLTWLAAARRPALEDDAVALYRRLFALAPADANTAFLAEALAAGRLTVPEADEILLAAVGQEARPDWLAALARALAARQRADAEALEWLRRAHAAGLTDDAADRWLAWAETLAGATGDEVLDRRRRLLYDPEAPLEWRLAAGLALPPSQADLTALAPLLVLADRPDELLSLPARLPGGEALELAADLCRERFTAGDLGRAAALAEQLVTLAPTDENRYRLAALRLRLAAREAGPPPDLAGQGPRWERLCQLAEGLFATLPAGDPAAEELTGEPWREPAAVTPNQVWLAAQRLAAAGRPAEALAWLAEATEPDLRLWQRYLAGPRDWAGLLPLARRAGQPWAELRPALLDRVVRAAPPEVVAGVREHLSAEQSFLADLRELARRCDAGTAGEADLADLTGQVPEELLTALQEVAAARRDEPELAPPTDRGLWLRALAAWRAGDEAGAEALVAELSPAFRARPEVAWTLAGWWPPQAARYLSQALRAHRERVDLRAALAALAARAGDAEALTLRAADLPEPLRQRAELARRLLAGELIDPPADCPLTGRYVARQHWLAGRGEAALAALAEATDPESVNFRAWLRLVTGDPAGALAELDRLPADPAVRHNRAVAAEALGELPLAAAEREAELADSTLPPADRAAAHRYLAELYRALDRPAAELRHRDAALALEPDTESIRATLPALLALDRGEEALERSQRTLAGATVAVELEHAALLAAVRGAPEAAAFLDDLALRRPEAAEAVAARRAELFAKLNETIRERAAAKDYFGLFAAARDAETVAPDAEQEARMLLHQAVALGNLSEGGESAARLELAWRRCREVLDRPVSAALRRQAEKLAGEAARHLAPALRAQAEQLRRQRTKELAALRRKGLRGPRAARAAAALAEAFERLGELYRRAGEFGEPVAEALAEVERLTAAARALGDSSGGAGG